MASAREKFRSQIPAASMTISGSRPIFGPISATTTHTISANIDAPSLTVRRNTPINIPSATPNRTEPNSSQPTSSAVAWMSTAPPITAPVIASAIENITSTVRSATTTDASSSRLSGPSAFVSPSIAIATAGDCADSDTPITAHTTITCSSVMPSNRSSHGCTRNSTPAIVNIAAMIAYSVIPRSTPISGRTFFRSSSLPASSPRIVVAVSATMRSASTCGLCTKSSRNGPAITPAAR